MGHSSIAKFIKVKNDGSVVNFKTHKDWRQSWFQIVPGSFVGGGFGDLLFYDRVNGEAKVFSSDGKGNITLAKHKTWQKGWDIIVPGNFLIGPNLTDLILYSRSKGEIKFLRSDNHGDFKKAKVNTGWRKSWDIIVPFDTAGAYTGLLFYDRTNGEGKIFSTDGKGNLKLIKHYKNWKKTWDIIVPGNFGKNLLTSDLLFYSRVVGEAKFFSTAVNGKITLLAHHTNWSPHWDILLPLNSSGSTKLLCYNRMEGLGLVASIQSYNLLPIKSHTNWSKTWSFILRGHFTADSGYGLMFYQHRIQLKIRAIQCSDDDGGRKADISVSQVNQWIDTANKVYSRAGIQFDPIAKLHEINNTSINNLAKKNKDEKLDTPKIIAEKQKSKNDADAYAKKIKGEIVVYFRYGRKEENINPPVGDGFSSADAEYVAMPGFSVTKTTAYFQDGSKKDIQNIKLLAHELGHYLGLHHTHPGGLEIPKNSRNPDQVVINYLNKYKSTSTSTLDGDSGAVRDTPADVTKEYFLAKGWNPADYSHEVKIKNTKLGIALKFNPDRHNLMSYFNCDDYYRMTQDQYRRVQEFLHSNNRKHLL